MTLWSNNIGTNRLCLYFVVAFLLLVMPTFGAVVVLVELSVLGLLLPADQVVGQVAVGKSRGRPLHQQLGGGVGEGARLPGHRRHCGGTRVTSG